MVKRFSIATAWTMGRGFLLGAETLGAPRILRHRARRIEPALITGQTPNIGNRITTHPLGAGHR